MFVNLKVELSIGLWIAVSFLSFTPEDLQISGACEAIA
jgi:hypothetical protein